MPANSWLESPFREAKILLGCLQEIGFRGDGLIAKFSDLLPRFANVTFSQLNTLRVAKYGPEEDLTLKNFATIKQRADKTLRYCEYPKNEAGEFEPVVAQIRVALGLLAVPPASIKPEKPKTAEVKIGKIKVPLSVPEKIIDAEQVARILGISRANVYKLAEAKKFPSYRPSPGVIRFKRSEILAYLDSTKY